MQIAGLTIDAENDWIVWLDYWYVVPALCSYMLYCNNVATHVLYKLVEFLAMRECPPQSMFYSSFPR
jgi:hypothetical protein